MLPQSLEALLSRYRWTSFTFILIFIYFPQWLSSVYSLISNEPLAHRLAGSFNMKLPDWSLLWITAPLGLLMFVYLVSVIKSSNASQHTTPDKLFFLSIDRFIYDANARSKVAFILVIFSFAWILTLQNRVHHLEVQMFRYVLPRELTKEQIEIFGKHLASSTNPQEVRIRYIMGDSEALRYSF
jgi:hypothetical protein